jgi:hypothetical protein
MNGIKAMKILDKKVRNCINKKEPLFCIGYYLPDITIKEKFIEPVYFSDCRFYGKADFGANFERSVFL